MKRLIICTMLALLVVCSPAGHAQQANPVKTLRNTVMADAYLFHLHNGSDDSSKALEDATKGLRELDNLIKPALDAATGYPDLRDAIKAFYVSAKTYFDSATTSVPAPQYDPQTNELYASPQAAMLKNSQMQMKNDVDKKANAMMLEARLAGIDLK